MGCQLGDKFDKIRSTSNDVSQVTRKIGDTNMSVGSDTMFGNSIVNVGQILVKYRSLRGISTGEIAEKLGLTEDYVCLLEWGLVRNVSNGTRQGIIKLIQTG